MSSIRIRYKRIEPHNARGEIRRYEIARRGAVKVERAVEITHSEIDAVTRAQKILNFGIGLRSSECFWNVYERNFWNRQHVMREKSDNHFRDQCLCSLPRTAKLRDE